MENLKKNFFLALGYILGIPSAFADSIDDFQNILFKIIKTKRVLYCIAISALFFVTPILNIIHLTFVSYIISGLITVTLLCYPLFVIDSYFKLPKNFRENNKIFPFTPATQRSRRYNKVILSNELISFIARIYSYFVTSIFILYVISISKNYFSLVLTFLIAILLFLTLFSSTEDFDDIFNYASARKRQGLYATIQSTIIIALIFVLNNPNFYIPILPESTHETIFNAFKVLSIINFIPAAIIRLPVDISHEYLILTNNNSSKK